MEWKFYVWTWSVQYAPLEVLLSQDSMTLKREQRMLETKQNTTYPCEETFEWSSEAALFLRGWYQAVTCFWRNASVEIDLTKHWAHFSH